MRKSCRRLAATVLALSGIAACGCLAGCGGSRAAGPAVRNVPYSRIQSVFEKYGCTACHPGVNPSLDLRKGRSYAALVGIRAVDDPTLYRVVAGDPGKSFLYLKVGGDPAVADIPAIGSRMPLGGPPIAVSDRNLIRDWILGGAKGPNGKTGGPMVKTPGSPPTGLRGSSLATSPTGTGTIRGTVVDQRRRPIAGALVTLLLQGDRLEGGEEHYRVAQTDAAGRFELAHAPAGRFLLKAYAPRSIYVSRIVALRPGGTARVEFGLPRRVVPNPLVSAPVVAGSKASLLVRGTNLDHNYILAVNPRAGRVFELHRANDAPGRWTATLPHGLHGPWVFMAVDTQCNVSDFVTVGR
jgi:Carboxypeptidase regulatory-like domain